MHPILIAPFLFLMPFQPAMAAGPVGQCDYYAGRFCLSEKPDAATTFQDGLGLHYRFLAHGLDFTIDETPYAPTVKPVEGTNWRLTYKRHKTDVAILIEQRNPQMAWWDFYLIGQSPVLHVAFKGPDNASLWQFSEIAGYTLHACDGDSRQSNCQPLQVLRQLIHGHYYHEGELNMRPGIDAAFQQVVAICEQELDHPCIGPVAPPGTAERPR